MTARRARIPAHLLACSALVAALAPCGCRDERPPGTTTPAAVPDTARRVARLDSARWTIVEDADESTLADALDLAADDSTVYVLAGGGRRLVALDARDGARRWSLPAAAGAPLTPMGATAVTRTPLGNLAVLDGRARQLAIVGAEGRVRERLAIATEGEPSRLCAREDGGTVVAGGDARGRLVALRADGAFDWTLVLPWPEADTLDALRLQASLASTPDGTACVAALRLGRGFATLRAVDPPLVAAHAYLEPVAFPGVRSVTRRAGTTTTVLTTLDDAPAAATDVAATRGMVAIAFEGATAERHRVVDLHALDDGRYRGSLLHATPVVAIAAWETRLYVLHRARGRFALAAYDVPALRDGVPARAPVRPLAPAPTTTAERGGR